MSKRRWSTFWWMVFATAVATWLLGALGGVAVIEVHRWWKDR